MRRLTIAGVLGATLLASLVWFGTISPAPGVGDPPTEADFVGSYDRFVGREVLAHGTVTTTDPTRIRVRSEEGEVLELEVVGTDKRVSPGDGLNVFGVLEPGRQITATTTVHKPESDYRRAVIASLVAALWVLARALHHCRFDAARLVVERRPVPLGARLAGRGGEPDDGEDGDA